MALAFHHTEPVRHVHRTPITAWRLMIWAYRIQMVHYDAGFYEEPLGDSGREPSALDWALAESRWRNSTAHPDAFAVHEAVKQLAMPTQRKLLIESAAVRRVPVWNPDLPRPRVVAERWPSGRLRMLRDSGRRETACLIRIEGVMPEEAEAIRADAQDAYALWWSALRQVRGMLRSWNSLERFCVTEIGAPRAPWLTKPLDG